VALRVDGGGECPVGSSTMKPRSLESIIDHVSTGIQ
jgi:hypothetical protein